jgi:organic radical activating enzyme
MLSLEYCEFYITNVCNLNCPRCNRYNNYAFSGHQRWDDYADIYQAWSKRLDIPRIGILGGEPLLNPDFDKWLKGIARLWPDSNIFINSNGTQLDRWPDLYRWLDEYKGRVRLDINRHNREDRPATLAKIESLFPGTYRKFYVNSDGASGYFTESPNHDQQYLFKEHNIGPEIWEDTTFEIAYRDQNSILIRYATADVFDNISVEFDSDTGSLRMPYMSDAERAISNCGNKWSHHLSKGKLYKCSVTAVLPDFVQQYKVSMSDQQRELVTGYKAAEVTWSDSDLSTFLDNLKGCHSIAQCQLCPENFSYERFSAGRNKIRIEKAT